MYTKRSTKQGFAYSNEREKKVFASNYNHFHVILLSDPTKQGFTYLNERAKRVFASNNG